MSPLERRDPGGRTRRYNQISLYLISQITSHYIVLSLLRAEGRVRLRVVISKELSRCLEVIRKSISLLTLPVVNSRNDILYPVCHCHISLFRILLYFIIYIAWDIFMCVRGMCKQRLYKLPFFYFSGVSYYSFFSRNF